MTAADGQDRHVVNYRAFAAALPSLLPVRSGEFVLIVSGEIKAFFSSTREAIIAAKRDGEWPRASVMRIEPQVADMGFFDCADYPR